LNSIDVNDMQYQGQQINLSIFYERKRRTKWY